MTPREARAHELADAKAEHIAALRAAPGRVVGCGACGSDGEREDAYGRWTCAHCAGTGEVVGEETYEQWIARYVAREGGFVRGKCDAATAEMVAAFPELRRAAGFVLATWGEDQHWWCVAPDGSIVDPTAAQFLGCIGGYDEVDPAKPHRPIPTGPCGNCGDDAFNGEMFCSRPCAVAFARDCGVHVALDDDGPLTADEIARAS